MNKVRLTILAGLAILIAGCASTPSGSSAPAAAKAPNLVGDWLLTISSQMGDQDSEMSVQQAGNQISGNISGQMGLVPYTGTVDGNNVAFSFTVEFGGNSLKIDHVGTVEPDGTLKGKAVFGSFGEGTFVAKKKK
jgi:hypothetical protein